MWRGRWLALEPINCDKGHLNWANDFHKDQNVTNTCLEEESPRISEGTIKVIQQLGLKANAFTKTQQLENANDRNRVLKQWFFNPIY